MNRSSSWDKELLARSAPNRADFKYVSVLLGTLPVRIRGDVPEYGRVEILSGVNWLPVCAERNWNGHVGDVVCRQLGFPAVKEMLADIDKDGVARMSFWKYSIYCNGSEGSVFHCSMKDDLHVRCERFAKIRCKPGDYN